jgi:hypothetical protein
MRVLEDYLSIFLEYDGKILSKEEKQIRQKDFYLWFKKEYLEIPSINQILNFISEHNLVINDLFSKKVILPCINKLVEEANIEELMTIFHANSSGAFNKCNVFTEYFKFSNFKYSSIQLVNMVLKHYPNDEVILNYKLQLLVSTISYTVHEVPIGVFPSIYNNGVDFVLEDSLRMLNEYRDINKLLNYPPTKFETEFIVLCEKIYRCYNDYLNCSNNQFKNFEDYLLYNNVDYNELFTE